MTRPNPNKHKVATPAPPKKKAAAAKHTKGNAPAVAAPAPPSAPPAPPPKQQLPVTVAAPIQKNPDGTADLDWVMSTAILPALRLLESKMTSDEAKIMMLSIGQQESQFLVRTQGGGGPAHGFWQFEKGGGVKGVVTHSATKGPLESVCLSRGVPFDVEAIYQAITIDDVLAAACARLLLWSDPYALPPTYAQSSGWDLYLRCWRPGKPHPDVWPANYERGRALIVDANG